MAGPLHYLHVFSTFGAGGPQERALELMGMMGTDVRHTIVAMDGETSSGLKIPAGISVDYLSPPPGRGFLGMGLAFFWRFSGFSFFTLRLRSLLAFTCTGATIASPCGNNPSAALGSWSFGASRDVSCLKLAPKTSGLLGEIDI